MPDALVAIQLIAFKHLTHCNTLKDQQHTEIICFINLCNQCSIDGQHDSGCKSQLDTRPQVQRVIFSYYSSMHDITHGLCDVQCSFNVSTSWQHFTLAVNSWWWTCKKHNKEEQQALPTTRIHSMPQLHPVSLQQLHTLFTENITINIVAKLYNIIIY